MFTGMTRDFSRNAEVNMDLSATVSEQTMKQIAELVHNEYSRIPNLKHEIDVICQDCPGTTCIYWKDGTNTVVECNDGTKYSRKLGIVWAIAERAMGGKVALHDLLREYPEFEDECTCCDDCDGCDEDDFEDDFEERPFEGGMPLPFELVLGMALLPILLGMKEDR